MNRELPDLRDNRLPVILALGLGLGLNLAFLFLVNIPRGQGLQSADQRFQELSRELDRRSREVDDLGQAVERIRTREQTLELFFEEVLADKARRMVPVQREIREIALRHRIDPESLTYNHEQVQEGEDMVRFRVNFPLKGGYQALRSFIRDVEHSENFLIIDGISLTGAREGGVMLALSIQVSTMFRDPEVLERKRGGE